MWDPGGSVLKTPQVIPRGAKVESSLEGLKFSKAKSRKNSRLLLLKGRKREKYSERNIINNSEHPGSVAT